MVIHIEVLFIHSIYGILLKNITKTNKDMKSIPYDVRSELGLHLKKI